MDLRNDNVRELWEILSELISVDKRNDAALLFLEYLQKNDYDPTDLQDLHGEDDHIDFAIGQLHLDEDDYISSDEFDE